MKGKHSETGPETLLRIVLVLQHEHIYWFKIIDGRITERKIHALPGQEDETNAHCPWLQGTDGSPQHVELILDSTLDEVNRVGVSQCSSVIVNAYRRWMTLGRARRDFPHAKVYTLSADYKEHVAAIMHSVIPERWSRWLLALQAQHVVFQHVSMGSELIERWSHHFDRKTLVLMSSDRNQRHLLVDGGATVFLRSVPKPASVPVPRKQIMLNETFLEDADNDDLDVNSLLQSMTHLVENGVENVSKALVVKLIDSAEKLRDPNDTQQPKRNTLVECLVAMHLGAPVTCQLSEWRDSRLNVIETLIVPSGSSEPALKGRFSRFRRILWLRRLINIQLSSGSTLHRLSALAPSVTHLRFAQRLKAGYQLSLVLAGVAVLATILSITNSIAGHRVAHNAQVQRLQIEESELVANRAAGQLFNNPSFVAASLSLSTQLTSPRYTLAEPLLGAVATALMAVPDISLDQLVWVRVEDDSVYESLGHVLGGVPYRETIEATDNEIDIQLEISGHVSGDKLAEQKSRLDEFIDKLNRMSHVVNINLLESPVDTALSSDHGIKVSGRYRVSVNLGGRP